MQYTLDIPFITWSLPVSLHQGFSYYAVLDMHTRYGSWVDLNDIVLYIKKWNIPSRGIKLLGFIECVNSSNLFYRYWNKTKLHEHLSLNREKDCKVLVYQSSIWPVIINYFKRYKPNFKHLLKKIFCCCSIINNPKLDQWCFPFYSNFSKIIAQNSQTKLRISENVYLGM